MAVNDRVVITSGDVAYDQKAPSKAAQTNYYPGKATARVGDMNWEKDFKIPTSTTAFDGESAGPVTMARTRVELLGRNIICDQTIPAPTPQPGVAPRVETRTEVGVSGTDVVQDMEQPPNLAVLEKTTGSDNIASA